MKKNNIAYGFIGAGNMGSAIINGLLKNKKSLTAYAYDIDKTKIKNLSNKVKYLEFNNLINKSDVIVLAVKPQMMDDVLNKISKLDYKDKLFISIAAGLDGSYFESKLNRCRLVRVMPNINAIYNQSISAICKGSYASNFDLKLTKGIFDCVGETIELNENQLPGFGAIAGASPAYTFMYADALALAGVKAGIPRDLSIKIAAQAIKGSATTLLESNLHPDLLRDRVCSPGGTTIEGVKALEETSFKGNIMQAIEKVIEKDLKLNKQKQL